MVNSDDWYSGLAKKTAIVLLCLIVVWGFAMVLFPIKPFWVDEWRLLYNLKFKSASELWGPLEYTQQFPRVFLQVLKRFTASFDYSYFSLRLPALVAALGTVLLGWRLSRRLFDNMYGHLFLLIVVSSQTFTDYLVQIKQYEMEIFLSLVAMWQLVEICELNKSRSHPYRYTLLCSSFVVAPFFSYTYPIAAAPIYFIALLKLLKGKNDLQNLRIKTVFPLALGAGSTLLFYVIDVSQLMQDQAMRQYWSYRMLDAQHPLQDMSIKLWGLFAKTGSGFVYEIIFGVLGIAGLAVSIGSLRKHVNQTKLVLMDYVLQYIVILIATVVGLFLAGKLPLSEPKFNAFVVPAIAIMIAHTLQVWRGQQNKKKASRFITAVLFLGLAGNIISTIVNSFTAAEYPTRMAIYKVTQQTLKKAQQENIPITVTPRIGYPDDIINVAAHLDVVPPHIVLMTFPAYEADKKLPVYSADNIEQAKADFYINSSKGAKMYIGDGVSYELVIH